ncbi:MAG: hypothetical protein FJY92_09750, partial [Candidatus Hydrogenedentes bacterium]|nr:hypothetical protein [Candidatus Hydrogenedentota bacterium]
MAILAFMTALVAALPQWDFDSQDAPQAWAPNGHLANVSVHDGIVSADATDWDPSFGCRSFEFAATPWQYVHIRIKANRPGACDLFWSGELEGQYGGLTELKKQRFQLAGAGEWEDVVLFPFWQREGAIRQFRLDLFANAHFDIDFVRVGEWGDGSNGRHKTFVATDFKRIEGAPISWANRLDLAATTAAFATILATSEVGGETANLCWSSSERVGMQRAAVPLRAGEHIYNVPLRDSADWCGTISALGLELPAGVEVSQLSLGAAPGGGTDVALTYLGFENGLNRAGRPCRILARFKNFGGAVAPAFAAALLLPPGLAFDGSERAQPVRELKFGESADAAW